MTGRVRVAVSGAGGGVGQSIMKALQGTEYDVVALDSDHLATGLYAAHRSYVVPGPHEPTFVDEVLDICRKQGCRLLFPGLDTELPVLARAYGIFVEAGVTPVVSSPEVVKLSDNKLLTYRTLIRHGIRVPKTTDLSTWPVVDRGLPPYPFVLKRREGGSRSRDVYLVSSRNELEKLIGEIDLPRFIAQEYIDGPEYTCGSVNLDGKCMGVIAMRRTLRDGDTYKCFAVRDAVVEGDVRTLMNQVKPFGACNVQLRMRDGESYVFEINARCSGTTAARALCGFNEPRMVADYLCHGKRPQYEIREQTVLRYWNELAVSNEDIDTMANDRRLELDDRQYL